MKTRGTLFHTGIVVVPVLLGLTGVRAYAEDKYQVDPVHSSILFRVKHLGIGYVWGTFRKFGGTIVLDQANPSRSSVEFTVDPASVDTGSKGRDKHLRSPDFFNVRQAPKWTFRSQSVKKTGEHSYQVTGDLRIKNVSRKVSLQLRLVGQGKDPWGNQRIGWTTRFKVNRMDHGISYMPQGLSKEVEVFLDVEAVKK